MQLSWQLECADRALAARPAAGDSLDDLADEVAALGRRLFWDPRGPTFFYPQFGVTLGDPRRVSWSGLIDDPDDPVRLVNRLEATALGCAWLLDRWGELRGAATGPGLGAVRALQGDPAAGPSAAGHRRGRSGAADLRVVHGGGSDGPDRAEGPDQRAAPGRAGAAGGLDQPAVGGAGGPSGRGGRPGVVAGAGGRGGVPAGGAAGDAPGCPESSGAEWEFDASEASERLRRYQATCDRSLLRVLEALRKRRRDASGPASEGAGPPARPNPRSRRRTRCAGSRAC